MIDSIREKLLSYALGEGDPEWRQEVESLLTHDVLHQKVWKQLLPARRAIEMNKPSRTSETSQPSKTVELSETNALPNNLSHRTMLLVEYSKRINPPAVTVRGKRDFLQDVFAPHNIPLPGGVPLRGTAWKDATPHESSSGSKRPTPRSRHEKAVSQRSHPAGPNRRVIQSRKRPPARAAVVPAPSSFRPLDVLVLSGFALLWAPILLFAVTSNHHEGAIGHGGSSLYQFSQELLGGMEPSSFRTSALPKIAVESIPPVGSSGKMSHTNFASSSTPSPVRWVPTPTQEEIAPLYAAESYPTTLRKSPSSDYSPPVSSPPLIRPVSLGSSSRNMSPPIIRVRAPSSRMSGNRSPFASEPNRLPTPSRSAPSPFRSQPGTPIFFVGSTP